MKKSLTFIALACFALVFCDYNELKEMLMPAKVIENTLF